MPATPKASSGLPRDQRSRRGITLLEVLISIGILAIGLTCVLGLIVAGRTSAAGVTVTDSQGGDGSGMHVCRLDDMLDEMTHLRLEIEGAELAALNGANGIIKRNRPKLIISAYHKATDFLDLTRFVEEIDLNYQMRLRHQSLEPGVLCIYAV